MITAQGAWDLSEETELIVDCVVSHNFPLTGSMGTKTEKRKDISELLKILYIFFSLEFSFHKNIKKSTNSDRLEENM